MYPNKDNRRYFGTHFQLGQARHGYALLNSFRRVAECEYLNELSVSASSRDACIRGLKYLILSLKVSSALIKMREISPR